MRWQLYGLLGLILAASTACRREVAGGVADGPSVFAEACAPCHGATGRPPPERVQQLGVRDLTDPALQQRLSDADIRSQILHGSDNKRMPSFEGALTEQQVDALVRFVRSLDD